MQKACNYCGHSRPINAACPGCGRTPRRQLSTTARGYDGAHNARRRMLLPLAWHTDCPLCAEVMLPDQPLALDHTIPLAVDASSVGDRIVHAACNASRGARVTA